MKLKTFKEKAITLDIAQQKQIKGGKDSTQIIDAHSGRSNTSD